MANRTLQFYGTAYGDATVQINAHINGQLVFSGPVTTVPGDIPVPDITSPATTLFTVPESSLVPVSFAGTYPVTVSVATGSGILLNEVWANYMSPDEPGALFDGSISGTTLTVTSVDPRSTGPIEVGHRVTTKLPDGTLATLGNIVSGSGKSWTLDTASTTSETHMGAFVYGSADVYQLVYDGNPTNSDNNFDCYSAVTIDGVAVDPIPSGSVGNKTLILLAGSTLVATLNISEGSE